MNTRPGFPDAHQLLELRGLVAGLCEAQLTATQVARLEEMVVGDAACAAYYVNAMSVYATLPQHLGVARTASGVKLVAEWQARDNDFWNDVVKVATVFDDIDAGDVRVRLSSDSEQKSALRPVPRIFKRIAKWADKFEGMLGARSQNTWLTLVWLTGSMFALVFASLFWAGGGEGVRQSTFVARLTKTREVVWGGTEPSPAVQSLLTLGQRLVVARGLVEVTFDSGAVVVMEGPAEFEVQSANQGFLYRGRTVAKVPAVARGFAIEANGLRVVDLGTDFGLEVDERQNANVNVLTGIVEAYLPAKGSTAQPVRIVANRALHYNAVAKSLAQVPVERSRFENMRERLSLPVISAVVPSSGKPYRIVHGGLREGALAYIDRDYKWHGLDHDGVSELVAADYVMTSNNDDLEPNFQLQVTLSAPATLYVLFDDRTQPSPEWLVRDYVDTGSDAFIHGADVAGNPGVTVDVKFSVWKRQVPAGIVTLGPTGREGVAHYGVAAVARAKDR